MHSAESIAHGVRKMQPSRNSGAKTKGERLNMAKMAVLKVAVGKTDEAIICFLKSLLMDEVVEAIVIPKALPSQDGFVQTLIRDPEKLDGVCILPPTMPVQSARVVSNLSVKNLGKKTAAILKPCEIRASVELAKFLQVKLDNLYLIGVDCPGTFEVPDYAKMVQEGKGGDALKKDLFKGMEKGEISPPSGYAFRTACQMCEYPVPLTDVNIKLFGYAGNQEIGIEIGDKLVKEIEEKGILSLSENEPAARSEVVNKVVAERTKKRDALFQEFKGIVKDL